MQACTDPEILKVIFFGRLLVGVIKIVVPIGLIVFGMFDFSKALMGGAGDKKKSTILFFKRVMYGALIFFVPWIVELVIVSLGDLAEGVNFTDCLQNANAEAIAALQKKEGCYYCPQNGVYAKYVWGDYSDKTNCSFKSNYSTEEKCREQNDSSVSPDVAAGNGATGYLSSPLNRSATQQEFINSIGDNSKEIYYKEDGPMKGAYHGGTDLFANVRTRVYAMDGGRVYYIQDGCGRYGRHIILQHIVDGNTYYTIYAHLNSIEGKYKTIGMAVNKGDLIAYSGNSYGCPGDPKRSTTVDPHLHIGIAIEDGKPGSEKFPQTVGDASFLVGNFICTDNKTKYSIVNKDNLDEYKKCHYCS